MFIFFMLELIFDGERKLLGIQQARIINRKHLHTTIRTNTRKTR